MIVYVSIGNSDDELSQAQWANFAHEVNYYLEANARIRGAWFSLPHIAYQNACWCVEVVQPLVKPLQESLIILARRYGQDSIAWAEAPVTRFLGQEEDE